MLDNPDQIQSTEEAMELLDKQSLTAKSLSKKDIRNLERLKQKATDFSELDAPAKDKVRITMQTDDASYINQ